MRAGPSERRRALFRHILVLAVFRLLVALGHSPSVWVAIVSPGDGGVEEEVLVVEAEASGPNQLDSRSRHGPVHRHLSRIFR